MIITLPMSLISLSLVLLTIISLRQQARILQRKVKTSPWISDPERMVLATLTDKYRQSTDGARQHLH
jgi:hypothetical protein